MIPNEFLKLAKEYGWELYRHDEEPCLLIYRRGKGKEKQQINVWYGKRTVGTSLTHPKQGKTQLFRRRVPRSMMRKIFAEPRVHTKKEVMAYHTRPGNLSRRGNDKRITYS